MHPPEDLSLEEIRARKPKYLKKITTAIANAISFASSNAQQQHQQQIQSSILQHQQQQQQNMLAAQSAAIASAQEVRIENDTQIHNYYLLNSKYPCTLVQIHPVYEIFF